MQQATLLLLSALFTKRNFFYKNQRNLFFDYKTISQCIFRLLNDAGEVKEITYRYLDIVNVCKINEFYLHLRM